MPESAASEILNRVLMILRRSFPQYLRYARPYITPGHERVMPKIEQLATEDDLLAERVSRQVFDMGGLPDSGEFPMEFTDTHDLEIDFLVQEANEYQRNDLAELERNAASPALPAVAKSLIDEAITNAKRHLKVLEELRGKPGISTDFGVRAVGSNDMPISIAPTTPTHAT